MSSLPYYATPGSPDQLTGGPLPVQMAVAAPAQQQRVTVFFRWFMAIPHYVVLYFLAIAAGVVAFLGWWGALFTGRLPDFAANYLTGYIRWSIRVQAYVMLLTDAYPPFALDDDPAYPVRIAVAPGDRLNRLAVFFRFFLVIPASVLSSLVLFGGSTIVGFIAWLVALINGQLPTSLHLAYTAALRYLTRVNCYLYMLTPAYPGGLFGDGAATALSTPMPPAGDFGAAGGYGAPGGTTADPAEYGAPGGYGDPAGYGTPGGYGAPGGYGSPGGYGAAGYGGYGAAQAPAQPTDWRLILTDGARNLLGLFIGIGALFWVLWVVVIVLLASTVSTTVQTGNAIDRINAANTTLNSQLNNWKSTVQACTSLKCATNADAQAASFFTQFASTLHSTPMPANASAAADQLYSDATKAAQDLTTLSKTTSLTQYQSTVTSTGMLQTLDKFDTDNNALGTALNATP